MIPGTITNDFLGGRSAQGIEGLHKGRSFALDFLRVQQFGRLEADANAWLHQLARQWVLYNHHLSHRFPVHDAFMSRADMPMDAFFETLAVIISHVYFESSETGNPWLSKTPVADSIELHAEQLRDFLARWALSPEAYRQRWVNWRQDYPLSDRALPNFDFVPLMETPLVEAREGELVAPVLPLLLQKAIDEPYFVLVEDNSGRFPSALGEAFEEYAHSLVERLAEALSPCKVFSRPPGQPGVEYADSVLVKDAIVYAFEHKGGRQGRDFPRGGEGDRVLGPAKHIIDLLESDFSVAPEDGRHNDNGLLTRGLWQLARWGDELLRWIEQETGDKPQAVYPVVIHLADLRVETVSRRVYLNRLVAAARLFDGQFWMNPEWLHIADLEGIVQQAETNPSFQLDSVFAEKQLNSPDEGFDTFLIDVLGGTPYDVAISDVANDLIESASHRFWPRQTENELARRRESGNSTSFPPSTEE